MRTPKTSGFTLIELLIVIGLLAALAALILPSISADREKILLGVCEYNQHGTLHTIQTYYDIYGLLPDRLHLGTVAKATASDLVLGMSQGVLRQLEKTTATPKMDFITYGTEKAELASFNDAGLNNIVTTAYTVPADAAAGQTTPFNTATVKHTVEAFDDTVFPIDPAKWVTRDGGAITINGYTIAEWNAGVATAGEEIDSYGAGVTAVFFVSPHTYWFGQKDPTLADRDWTKGWIDISTKLVGRCPIPNVGIGKMPAAAATLTLEEPYYYADFPYYALFIKGYTGGAKARVLGITCIKCDTLHHIYGITP